MTTYIIVSIVQLCTGTNNLYLCYDWMKYCYENATIHLDKPDSILENCAESLPNELFE